MRFLAIFLFEFLFHGDTNKFSLAPASMGIGAIWVLGEADNFVLRLIGQYKPYLMGVSWLKEISSNLYIYIIPGYTSLFNNDLSQLKYIRQLIKFNFGMVCRQYLKFMSSLCYLTAVIIATSMII